MHGIRVGYSKLAAMMVCAAGLSSFTQSAGAANSWFMRDMPISKMNAEDVAIMQGAVFAALNSAADGEAGHWQNSKTGAHGDFTPRSSFMDSGLRCRDLEIENSAGGLNHRSMLTLCKTAEGWKIKSY
jgi:surface antigen